MANEVALKTGTDVALPGNPYLDMANEAGTKTIFGKLLKYTKGEYTAGEHEEEIPLGTRMIVVMDKMLRGWQRWEDRKVTDTNLVGPGEREPNRKECGDLDQSEWPLNNEGKLADPWQRTWSVLMLDKQGNMYTFSTSSNGGIGALKALAGVYGAHLQESRKPPAHYPVVELGTDSYKHTKFGRVNIPTFEVLQYVPIQKVKDAVAAGIKGGALKGEPDFVESENPGADLDDEIPF